MVAAAKDLSTKQVNEAFGILDDGLRQKRFGADGSRLRNRLARNERLRTRFVNRMYANWKQSNPKGTWAEFVQWLADWLKNGGFQAILDFIAGIIAIVAVL